MKTILLLNGPNLNLLGSREPSLYGHETLDNLTVNLEAYALKHGANLICRQSNAEHELINEIHNAYHNNTDFIIFNPGAYTHTSIALRDALLATELPFVEVHISNIARREAFRQVSYFSDIAIGTITGLGLDSYQLALDYVLQCLNFSKTNREHYGYSQS